MTKYNILREFRKWQVRTGAYGNINQEVREFTPRFMDIFVNINNIKGVEKKIKLLKKELIKKKYWDVNKNDWTTKAR